MKGPRLVGHGVRMSLSARRAWIEMSKSALKRGGYALVALRKESVDRNVQNYDTGIWAGSRSPQGERG